MMVVVLQCNGEGKNMMLVVKEKKEMKIKGRER